MKKFFVSALLTVLFLIPSITFAATAATDKTLSGTVTGIVGTQINFTNSSAGFYSAQTTSAQLAQRNGSPMQLSEILVGDKLQITGRLWPDNSITATYVRNMSLYTHNGTISGKITAIGSNGFTMQGAPGKTYIITVNGLTSYKKNSSSATLSDIQVGMSATVKGSWERQPTQIIAREVDVKLRLVAIYFTGKLMLRGPDYLNIVGDNNAMYAISLDGAQLQDKSGKAILAAGLGMGDTLRVWGKHVSGSIQIFASKVKDTGVNK